MAQCLPMLHGVGEACIPSEFINTGRTEQVRLTQGSQRSRDRPDTSERNHSDFPPRSEYTAFLPHGSALERAHERPGSVQERLTNILTLSLSATAFATTAQAALKSSTPP